MGKNIEYCTAIVSLCAVTAVVTYICQEIKHKKVVKNITKNRLAERKGRINAELQLRKIMKEQEVKRISTATDSNARSNDEQQEFLDNKDYLVRCVGTIVSPFTKRMGTPRQGALAPHSRGFIQLNPSVAPMETLSGIELFSHAWIIFQFHANTDAPGSVKAKIAPPRAGGLKVGIFASRSPHRPNPIGLSLVNIVKVDKKLKRLHVAALDLVNGTPVYDVKPVIPWDIPGHVDGLSLSVPNWVSQNDTLSNVAFTKEAEMSLESCIQNKKLAPLYTVTNDGFHFAKEAIREVLAQDPRAAKTRGKFGKDNDENDPYKVVFCSVQLEFFVLGEKKIEVVRIKPLDFDGVTRVDGIPLFLPP